MLVQTIDVLTSHSLLIIGRSFIPLSLLESMMLSLLSNVAGIVSAGAVLVSLLFVWQQMRQSVRNQRALIQQGRAGRSVDIAMRLVDSDFAEGYHRCMNGDTNITDAQLVQFIGYSRAVFLGAEDSFLQHRDHLLNERAFNSFARSLRSLFESPGMRAAWTILRDWYDAEFAAYMDRIVKEANNHPTDLQHARWKAAASSKAEVAAEMVRGKAA